MKTNHPILKKLLGSAFLGAASLLSFTSAHGAFMPVVNDTAEFPGVLLGGGTAGLSGTVIDSQENTFIATIPNIPLYSGTLRSMVVDRGGGLLDFYYQVINTRDGGINGGNDIFRLAIPGYGDDTAFTVDATWLSDGVATIAGLTGVPVSFFTTNIPNKGGSSAVYSADRDPALDTQEFYFGGAAFDFDPTQLFNTNVPGGPTTAPQNIHAGENSAWLVLRTNQSAYSNTGIISVLTSGGGTGLVGAFAPIPEPSTALFGLAMAGFCAGGRFRKSRRA